MAEFNSPVDEKVPPIWTLSVDDASNIKGSNSKIVLEGPRKILIEQLLKFEFRDSNNQVKYESLIVGMTIALEMGASRSKLKNDS